MPSSSRSSHADDTANAPLDVVEYVLSARDVPFDRIFEDALIAENLTHWCDVKLWCNWQEDTHTLQFSWHFGARVPEAARQKSYELLALVNERLSAGHFAFLHEDNTIAYRQTMMMAGAESLSSDQVDHCMDVALAECDRFYPALQSLIWGQKTPAESLEIAMFETMGEA